MFPFQPVLFQCLPHRWECLVRYLKLASYTHLHLHSLVLASVIPFDKLLGMSPSKPSSTSSSFPGMNSDEPSSSSPVNQPKVRTVLAKCR